MILYFTDRQLNMLGHASTTMQKGLRVTDDTKTEDVETGVAIFECTVPYNKKTMQEVSRCTKVGNYILRRNGKEKEFYTIIESEKDTKNQTVYIYAEDAGLDLLNEVVGAYEADKAYPISYYVEKFAYDSGFKIGVNEVKSLTRKLSWDGESTAVERLASVATQFDNAEISFSFDVKGMEITQKYINIYKKRGQDIGCNLRLNKEVDSIVTSESIANLATALLVKGGTPESTDAEDNPQPITLEGYQYDDGNYYVSGKYLCCREALKKWSRYIWEKEPNKEKNVGHIVKTYSYDTLSQKELCAHAVTELKKISEIEVNYEVDIKKMPANVRIGDRVNIIDDAGGLYLSTRLLKLETSVANQEQKATLGEYLLKSSGISQKVADLAEQFAQNSTSAKRALEIANKAKETAQKADESANQAFEESQVAIGKAEEAQQSADNALRSAENAITKADAAEQAVQGVVESVESITETVENAQEAADNAYKAAEQAEQKAEEAKQSLSKAEQDAAEAKEAAGNAQTSAESAVQKAEEASTTAGTAKTQAESASATAAAAKEDAAKAQEEIDNLGTDLTTLSNTMKADYARKTDLTEATAELQTQIEQNAGEIATTAKKVQTIDETANNAKEQADLAQSTAAEAQAKADAATGEATKAQEAADAAKNAADAAQSNADTAKQAADAAQNVATKAEEDLNAAKTDLETVRGRVDATEEDILAAEEKVAQAQAAADKAKADAEAAAGKATEAQNTANTAKENAENAQTAANDAANQAALAQKTADEAKGDATAAQTAADEAAKAATEAQNTANAANTAATEAQTKANQAAQTASEAQTKADAAAEKAATAQTDLDEAKKNLADVSSKVDATEEEVAAAQEAVDRAQAAADKAKEDALNAQNIADTARQNAENAQTAADTAKQAADKAQQDALNAKKAADKAQADADALAVRVTSAETSIKQNADKIALAATKEEVTKTLGGYYTKKETDAKIQVESERISSTVKKVETVEDNLNNLQVGGRNIAVGTSVSKENSRNCNYHVSSVVFETGDYTVSFYAKASKHETASVYLNDDSGANRIGIIFSSEINLTEEYQKFTFTKKNNKEYSGDVNGIVIRIYGKTETDNTISVKELKLEIGNKATDWSPAPEDVEEDIDNAQSAADDAKDKADSTEERVTASESKIEQLSDSISTMVTDKNGNSLMTQTGDGWTFNMGTIEDTLDDAKQTLKDLEGDMGVVDSTLSQLESLTNDLGKKTAYINMTTDDSGAPCLELGKSDSAFKVRISNTSVDFIEGSVRIAYISNRALYIERAIIKNEFQIGDNGGFIFRKRSSGNMCVRWVGGVD